MNTIDVRARTNSEALGHLAALTAHHGVAVHRADGLIVWANPTAASLFGVASERLRSFDPLAQGWRVIRPDGSPYPDDELPVTHTLATGQPVADRIVGVYAPDGSLKWFSVTSEPVNLPDGEPGVVVSFYDVTALRTAEQRQRLLFEHGAAPTVVLDPETGTVVDANRETSAWLGYEISHRQIGRRCCCRAARCHDAKPNRT